MANIKKINGYDIIDSNMYKATATITNLTKDEWTPYNNVDINLPTGWNINNTFIIGGYYKLKSGQTTTLMRPINSSTYDEQGHVISKSDVTYYGENSTSIACGFQVFADWLVGLNCEYTVLLYRKD